MVPVRAGREPARTQAARIDLGLLRSLRADVLAHIILDGVRAGAWRILVGEDAKMIDAAVRAKPWAAYDYAGLFSAVAEPPATGTPGR